MSRASAYCTLAIDSPLVMDGKILLIKMLFNKQLSKKIRLPK